MNLIFKEVNSTNPCRRFKYKVMFNNIHVAGFQTQIDHGYNLDGERESVYTIYEIKVKSLHRRKGIATQIINYCQLLAKEGGLKKVLCWVKPLDKNITKESLIEFYKSNKMRFVEDESHGNLYAIKDL